MAYEMRISDWSSDVCSSDLDHLFVRTLERGDMLPNGLIDIGVLRPLRRKVAGVVHAEIDHLFAFGLVERRRQMSGMRSDPRIPFFSVQIELRRFHWPI